MTARSLLTSLVAEYFEKMKRTPAVVQQDRGRQEWAGMDHKESRILQWQITGDLRQGIEI